jgi:peptidoglycan/LPS O-acetylase OafA/YrhL
MTGPSTFSFTKNNFDLVRLFAATQVAVSHTVGLLTPAQQHAWWLRLLDLFPGVPVFFFISGFLISRSFENSRDVGSYARNRVLRIFPGLEVCLLVNLLLVAGTAYFVLHGVTAMQLLMLFLAKGTFLQFYNPEFMREFGDGVLNGSLWTICVELQFYLLVPVLYRFFLYRPSQGNRALILIALASLLANRALYALEPAYSATVAWKLARVSFAPWFYMFVVGVLLQRNLHWLEGRIRPWTFPALLIAYVLYATGLQALGFRFDNGISPLLALPVFALILAAAFSKPALADRLLGRNDLSYGMYIYHMPVVNMFLYYGIRGPLTASALAIAWSLCAAYLSWRLIERPAMRFKRKALHAVTVPS